MNGLDFENPQFRSWVYGGLTAKYYPKNPDRKNDLIALGKHHPEDAKRSIFDRFGGVLNSLENTALPRDVLEKASQERLAPTAKDYIELVRRGQRNVLGQWITELENSNYPDWFCYFLLKNIGEKELLEGSFASPWPYIKQALPELFEDFLNLLSIADPSKRLIQNYILDFDSYSRRLDESIYNIAGSSNSLIPFTMKQSFDLADAHKLAFLCRQTGWCTATSQPYKYLNQGDFTLFYGDFDPTLPLAGVSILPSGYINYLGGTLGQQKIPEALIPHLVDYFLSNNIVMTDPTLLLYQMVHNRDKYAFAPGEIEFLDSYCSGIPKKHLNTPLANFLLNNGRFHVINTLNKR